MTKTDCHRTALACVAREHPHWWLLSLEMLSTSTCYSRLHWRWFKYVSPCYWTTWPSLVLARFRCLIDHMPGPYCSTCQFSIGTSVSCCGWVMCHFFIGPCVIFLLVHVVVSYSTSVMVLSIHVLFFYSATWLDGFLPRVGFLLAHVSCHGYFMCHALVHPCVAFLFDHVAYLGSTTCTTINSS